MRVVIKTPCYPMDVENTLRRVGELGFWDTATVTTDGNEIVISYGEEDR